ncbi:MAG TPA: carbohydrate porin [Reyranella sp.]|nr:carbohydrate porin [Reyranella sp.]
MTSRRTSPARTAGLAAFGLLLALPASAREPDGFYFGGFIGYGLGTATATLADPVGGALGSGASAGGTSAFNMTFGGLQGGYQKTWSSGWMLGLELDAAFPDYMDTENYISARATTAGYVNEQLEWLATARGRVGYAFGEWTPFLTGGLALGSVRTSLTNSITGNEDATPGNKRLGFALGGGVEHMLGQGWSARLEYLYANLGLAGFGQFNVPARYDAQYDFHFLRLGLNYHFGAPEPEKKADEGSERGPGSWEIHGQSTLIYQTYPPFSAAYDGPQSLPSNGQSRETWTTSLFLGVRLWEGGELYFNPELLQGFGIAGTTGAAGYPNGEAQKSNFPWPRLSLSRLFLRQEFGLGGETEKVESDYGQLAGTKDVSRITVQAGRFSVHDLFDTNDYAQDPRVDFLNWSIWAAGAFDYAADRIGLTYGIAAEYNQKDWAARAGYFLVGNFPNANVYDMNLFSRGQYVAELELRYKPWDRPGQAKFGVWMHETLAGNYSAALSLAALNPTLSPNDAIAIVRQGTPMYGYYVNLQQELTDDIGAFVRWSWNDGHSEISAFTDISSSLSLGTSIKGTRWGRPDDVVGIAGAINWASPELQAFLAAGGTGVLVGDGQLSYASEQVIEAYYAVQLAKGMILTADYQLLINPAYNTARGPVNVFAGRLHVQF